MQDIAGCRVVVATRVEQRAHIDALMVRLADHKLIDRLAKPSHGYRALHLVVKLQGRWVEVQVRTELQHLWAQLCELLADRLGAEIKYGGGDNEPIRRLLGNLSAAVDAIERLEEDPAWAAGQTIRVPGLPALNRRGLRALLESLGSFFNEALKHTT